MARASGHPEGSEGIAATDAEVAARACPPQRKQAATTITKAKVFIAAVTSCVPLPHLMPRHCKTKNPMMTRTAMSLTWPPSNGMSSPLYSPMTIATAAAVPEVESQSLQPTMKPAYSPSARREKLYWPPLRGMAAPSSAMEDAPESAYNPPATQTPKKR